MTQYEELLRLIETVDVNDTAKLDEIDARVWCFLRGYTFYYMEHYTGTGKNIKCFRYDDNGTFGLSHSRIQYTRSRDALKAIRPKGFCFQFYESVNPPWFECDLIRFQPTIWSTRKKRLLTEEMAELHAVIQAIRYERESK